MLFVGGYLCRVWYRGQPLICHLCKEEGHRAAVCPGRDKCRRCGETGHIARQCPNPWGTLVGHAPAPARGDDPAPGVGCKEPALGDDPVVVGEDPGSPQRDSPPNWGELMDGVLFSPVSGFSSDVDYLPESAPLAAALLPRVSVPPEVPSSFEVSPADPPPAQPQGPCPLAAGDGAEGGVIVEAPEGSMPDSALLCAGEGEVGDPPSVEGAQMLRLRRWGLCPAPPRIALF